MTPQADGGTPAGKASGSAVLRPKPGTPSLPREVNGRPALSRAAAFYGQLAHRVSIGAAAVCAVPGPGLAALGGTVSG